MRLKKLCALLLAVALTLGLCSCSIGKKGKYEKAVEAVRNGRYQEAIESLEALDGYEDSAKYITYARALQAGDSGDYENAIKTLEALNGFEKSAVYITSYTTLAYEAEQARMKSVYNQAAVDVKAGNYDAAIAAFETLNDYEDSGKYIMYARCLKTGDDGDYEAAVKSLKTLGDFKDATMYIQYYTALGFEAEQKYEEATKVYEGILLFKDVQARVAALPDKILDRDLAEANTVFGKGGWRSASKLKGMLDRKYSDSDTRMYENVMAYALQWREQKRYDIAIAMYELLLDKGYENASEALKEAAYEYAKTSMDSGDYTKAEKLIKERLSDYKDTSDLLIECRYQQALKAEAKGADSAQAAYVAFKALGAYKDSADRVAAYESKYAEAVSKSEAGEFDAAIALFKELGTYSDSSAQLKKSQTAKAYADAVSLMNDEKYEEAMEAFEALNGYSDSTVKIDECKTAILEREYQKAVDLMSDGKYVIAIQVFKVLNGYKDSMTQIDNCVMAITECEYQKAVDLMNDEKYEEAIDAFEGISGYNDSEAKIEECKKAIPEREYRKAVKLMTQGSYEDAIRVFEDLHVYYDYKDSEEQIVECRYQIAERLRENKQYEEAYAIYEMIREYKNVNEIMRENAGIAAARRAEYQTSNYVAFGSYPQQNDNSTPIEWLVLESDGETALLISRYVLDGQTYDSEYDVTWEHCELRSWLNNEFYSRAFSENEKQYILQGEVSADKNPHSYEEPGNATKDHVFLLSITEAERYFTSDEARVCVATDYAVQQGARVGDRFRGIGRNAWWWLRTCGYSAHYAARVFDDGSIDYRGPNVYGKCAVRPCVRVRLF